MTERESQFAVRRILLALDTTAHNLPSLESAVELASQLEAELAALFIEDPNLLRLAERRLHRVPGIEAFPLKREPSGELVIDLDRLACNPTLSWWSNFKPYNWRKWPTIPPNMEAHVIIGATMPTHQDIVDLKAKGWIISYNDAVIPLP